MTEFNTYPFPTWHWVAMAAKSLGWYISFFLPTEIRLVSKQLLLNDKSKLFQLYYDKNKLFLVRWWWCLFCTRPNGWVQFFSERKVHSLKYCSTQRHYPNSEGNQSLLLFFIAACLAEKQQIPILYSGLTRTGIEHIIYLKFNTLTITSLRRLNLD